MNRVHHKTLIESNIVHLKQIVAIIEDIDDRVYQNNDSPYFDSGIGKHLRHILGFYDQYLSGWQDRIDYDARHRDSRLEQDRNYGVRKTKMLIDQFTSLPQDPDHFEKALYVKNDQHGPADDPDQYTRSTVERELQFLRFHTVHHFAIMSMILKLQGIQPPKDFGYAPSTLEYLSAQAEKSS